MELQKFQQNFIKIPKGLKINSFRSNQTILLNWSENWIFVWILYLNTIKDITSFFSLPRSEEEEKNHKL
jgi:hypothetical protein